MAILGYCGYRKEMQMSYIFYNANTITSKKWKVMHREMRGYLFIVISFPSIVEIQIIKAGS